MIGADVKVSIDRTAKNAGRERDIRETEREMRAREKYADLPAQEVGEYVAGVEVKVCIDRTA